VVVVTHDPQAAAHASRQLHLEKGTFVEQGQAAPAAAAPAGVAR
jgi:putative ABC transport system ATP-binding protein